MQWFTGGIRRAFSAHMKCAWLGLLLGCRLLAGSQDSEFNVNTRYTVETVFIAGDGWTANLVSDHDTKITPSLRKELTSLIGTKLNPAALDKLAQRLRDEFHARTVEHHVMRGKTPEYVQVVFDIKLRPASFDVSVPKFLYVTQQGFSGALEGTASVKHSAFTAGLVSDGDELAERYTGVEARFENTSLGSNKVRFRFEFDSFHDQWNANTVDLAGPGALYRTRRNFQPVLTFALAKPLTLSVGASFERLQNEFPAAETESANALITTLRYHRRLEGSENQQDLDAGYDLRAATKVLHSNFVYASHRWGFRYTLTRGKNVVIDDMTAGLITGRAPLFEQFELGNSSTLRGWNKYELDPLGGNRMVHNSVEYRYGVFQIFYDSGAIWENGQPVVARASIGTGIREGPFSLAVAFPIRDGHTDPVFMVGMNY